jgi:LAO/AO transport system kinase
VSDLTGMLALNDALAASGHAGHVGAHGPSPRPQQKTDPEVWRIPVLKLVAQRGEGVDALVAACEEHRQHLFGTEAGRARLVGRKQAELARTFRELLAETAERTLVSELADASERVTRGEDPYALAEALLAGLLKQ